MTEIVLRMSLIVQNRICYHRHDATRLTHSTLHCQDHKNQFSNSMEPDNCWMKARVFIILILIPVSDPSIIISAGPVLLSH